MTAAFGADDTFGQTSASATEVDDLEHWLRDLRTDAPADAPADASDAPDGDETGAESVSDAVDESDAPAVPGHVDVFPEPVMSQARGRHRAED